LFRTDPQILPPNRREPEFQDRKGEPPPDKSLPRLEEFGSEGLQHLGVADCPESPVMDAVPDDVVVRYSLG
jgi:hypothetical protein